MKQSIAVFIVVILLFGCIQPPKTNTTIPSLPNISPIQINMSPSSNISVSTNTTPNISVNNLTNKTQNKTENTIQKQLTIPSSIKSNCIGHLVHMNEDYTVARMMGAGIVRPHPGPFVWGDVEKIPGTYNFSKTDSAVLFAQRNNLTILATIFPFADWDQTCKSNCKVNEKDQFYPISELPGKDDKPDYMKKEPDQIQSIPAKRCKPCNMTAYKSFLSKVVERYDGDGINDMPNLKIPIKYYEILNEPAMQQEDLTFFKGNEDDYIKILKASNHSIKSNCSDCKVVQGGVANIDQKFLSFWDNVYSKNGHNYFDIANIHYIRWKDESTLNVKDFKKSLQKHNITKPIWVTEVELEDDASLVSSFEGALNAGASKVFLVGGFIKIDKQGNFFERSDKYKLLPSKCQST